MSSFTCKCGCARDTACVPEKNSWIAYSGESEEEVIRREMESLTLDDDAPRLIENDIFVADKRTLIYDCPSCGRLAWSRGEDGVVEWFVSEK